MQTNGFSSAAEDNFGAQNVHYTATVDTSDTRGSFNCH